ncbi:MAG: helix-turn-helix transcriptional regulator [Butyrivibrio sp.]|nr:helix-turn-helix transcriptional regulator [Butyrivibrio sp.]
MSISTASLLNRLKGSKNFHFFVDESKDDFEERSLPIILYKLCEERAMIPSDVIRKAQIERAYGHQIFNGTRTPSRDKLIQLSLGFGLSLDEAQALLKLAGKSMLYVKFERDAACMFGISRGMSVMEVQELLESINLPLLGEN